MDTSNKNTEDSNASQCLAVPLYAVPDKLKSKVSFGVFFWCACMGHNREIYMNMYNRIRSWINRNVMRLIQRRFGDSLQTLPFGNFYTPRNSFII